MLLRSPFPRRRSNVAVVVAVVVAIAAPGFTACSSDGGSGPAPGGINGPARVEPNPGANNADVTPEE